MEREFLPVSDRRERIQDVIKASHMTQAELAKKIGCTESTLSRFLSGRKDSIDDIYILNMADVLNVSTDFLFGRTDLPDRLNHDISELGLTAKAAERLYKKEIHTKGLNLLIGHPRFPELSFMIARYLDKSSLRGVRVVNKQYDLMRMVLDKHVASHPEDSEAAANTTADLIQLKQPEVDTDIYQAQSIFSDILRDIRDNTEDHSDDTLVTERIFRAFVKSVQDENGNIDIHKRSPIKFTDNILTELEDLLPRGFTKHLRKTFITLFSLLGISNEKEETSEADHI